MVVCVRACVRGGRRGVCVSAHTLETSQSNRVCVITSNAEIMSNDHQHCRRTRAHTHAHMDTQLFSIPPHLLGPGGASQFQCQLCFVFAKHKSRHPEVFFFIAFYCEKNIIWRGKNFLQNECWLETGCTDGGICVC